MGLFDGLRAALRKIQQVTPGARSSVVDQMETGVTPQPTGLSGQSLQVAAGDPDDPKAIWGKPKNAPRRPRTWNEARQFRYAAGYQSPPMTPEQFVFWLRGSFSQTATKAALKSR